MTASGDGGETGPLGAFVRAQAGDLVPLWLKALRECAPAMRLPEPELIDHLPILLAQVAEAIDMISLGEWSQVRSDAAVRHAMGRLAVGLEIRDVLTEFFLLRHLLLQFVGERRASSAQLSDAQLVCWAIDAAVRESVAAFSAARHKTLHVLDRLAQEYLASHDLPHLLPRLLQPLLESDHIQVACIFLLHGDELQHHVAVGKNADAHERADVAAGSGLVGRVAAEGIPLAASTSEDSSPEGEVLRKSGIRMQYAVPLLARDELFGVVQFGSSREDEVPAEDRLLLDTAAQRIAAVITQARLLDRVERLAAERESLLRDRQLALDAAQMGWWKYDLVSGLTSYDQRCAEIFGESRPPGQRPNRELVRQIHPDDLPAVRAAIDKATNPSAPAPYHAEYRIQRPDGSMVWVEANGLALFEGHGDGQQAVALIGAVGDITERRAALEAIQLRQHQLVEMDRNKNEFLSTLSHELRNPLSPIRNGLFILDRAPPDSEQASRARTIMARQIKLLSRLIDDLLDHTRISRGKIRLERASVDLGGLLLRALEDRRPLLEGRELVISVPEGPVWVDGDTGRLEQVIANLFHNAVKFTADNGKIAVSLQSGPGEAIIEVADDGIGMDANTIASLFRPFAQAERSLPRSKAGLGIGLALVKGLVELHGGSISASSAGPWRGSSFTLRLPLGERTSQSTVAQHPSPPPGTRSILLIDDNVDAASTLCEVLAMSGHRIEVTATGEAGLERAQELLPDLVICDVDLPGIDGYEVARRLRQDSRTAHVVLVALTGGVSSHGKRQALAAGFDAWLVRPADLEQLEHWIRKSPKPTE